MPTADRNPQQTPTARRLVAGMLAATMLAGAGQALAQTVRTNASDASLNALANANTGTPDALTTSSTTEPPVIRYTPPGATANTDTTADPTLSDTQDADSTTSAQRTNLTASRENMREESVDGLRPAIENPDVSGVRIGTFVIRPSISQGVGVEKTVSGGSATTRTYYQTGINGDIVSDWSRHELRLTGAGIWQKNISGAGETNPSVTLDAKLRLDVTRDTIVNLKGGYAFARESSTDPNSVSGASVQSGVHTFKAGAEAVHDFGVIRGTVGLDLTRNVYGPATLANGSLLYLGDRDQTTGELRLRAGYELSPVLMPFVEASAGRMIYDRSVDTSGYRRDGRFYAGKAGLEFDFGDKLRGELSAGYKRVDYLDARLAAIGAMTVDANATWSPRRGSDVTFGVSTSIDPSTTAGVGGSTAYTFSAGLSQQMIDNLVARLSGSGTLRRYASGSADQTEWAANAGLAWSISRYTDLTADLRWRSTDVKTGSDTTVWSAIAGVRFKR